MKLSALISILESWAPLVFQEPYDNSGLQIGHLESKIDQAIVCLDCTQEVIQEAIDIRANLIISHHPLLFHGIKKITGNTYIERIVEKAIQNKINIYSLHTNLDNISDGVNAMLAQQLSLKHPKILLPKKDLLYKLCVMCPKTHQQILQEGLFQVGAGRVGLYDHCSFNTDGIGTFRPLKDSKPYKGSIDKLEKVREVKLEVIVSKNLIGTCIEKMKILHPYQEVAYDLIALENIHPMVGSGIIGTLSHPLPFQEFLAFLKAKLDLKVIKYTAGAEKNIKKVSVCGGAGSFLIQDAIDQQADVFISSDFSYHQFFDHESKIIICDIGHFESENFTSELIIQKIKEKNPKFAIQKTNVNTNPIKYYF